MDPETQPATPTPTQEDEAPGDGHAWYYRQPN